MRKLLAANFTRLWKMHLFWGTLLLHAAFGVFRIYTIYDDRKYGYTSTLDEALFSSILIEGLVMAVFIGVFLGTEYSNGTVRNKITVGHERFAIYLVNLITAAAACFLSTAVYLLTVLVTGTPVLGTATLSIGVIVKTLLGTLVTAAAFCSIYTFIGMSVSHKSTSCILCILLFFGLLICTTYAAAMLDAPPERQVFEMVNGEPVSHMEPNPKYPSENKRAIYQFLLDFLPTGQAIQYVIVSAKPLTMALYSGVIILITTGGGLLYFRRKDIR